MMLRQINRAIEIINGLGMEISLGKLNVNNLDIAGLPVVRWWRVTSEDEFFEALDKLEPFDGILVGPPDINTFLTINMNNVSVNKQFPFTIVSFLTQFNMTTSAFVLSSGEKLVGLIINSTGSVPIQIPSGVTLGPPAEVVGVMVTASGTTPGYGVMGGNVIIRDSMIAAPIPLAVGSAKVINCQLQITGTGPGIMLDTNFGTSGTAPKITGNSIQNKSTSTNVNGIEVYSFKKAVIEENDIYDVSGSGILLTGTSTQPSEFTIVFKNLISPGSSSVTPAYGVRETSNTDSNIIVGNIIKATTAISTTSTTTITDDNIT